MLDYARRMRDKQSTFNDVLQEERMALGFVRKP